MIVDPQRGDVFLALDLCAHILPSHRKNLLRWKRRGVGFVVVVYDILPLREPGWFSGKLVAAFRRWILLVVVLADEVRCISGTTAADFLIWIDDRYNLNSYDIKTSVLPIRYLQSFHPFPNHADIKLPPELSKGQYLLAVGTIEPRKGYTQLLDAYDYLCESGDLLSLVIVGKPGWKTERLQQRLRKHDLLGKYLFWFDSADDSLLGALYRSCAGVVMPSYAEGLGLPLLEAKLMGKPVLVRDLPVYRELREAYGEYKSFPSNVRSTDLAEILRDFAKSVV
jgi:glycosyltransferase involved in cell wall biosynthesis